MKKEITITLNKDNPFELALIKIGEIIKGTKWENNVFAVGGCVRDKLMGKPIKDIDLAITYPNGGIEFANWICKETYCYKLDSNPCVFPKYGTAKFNIRSIEAIERVDIECVQTRKEQYKSTESRNPETCYGNIIEDAFRRDLTINALYLNLSKMTVWDVTEKGLDDLHNQIIRTPSVPDIIFKDDPLRLLRVIRFASRFNWGIEKDTWLGMVKNAYRIDIISKERIKDELCKMMECDTPSVAIKRLDGCGLLDKILPEIYRLKGVKQGVQHFGDVYEHTLATLDKTHPVALHRLAALFHDCGKPATFMVKQGAIHFYNHENVSGAIAKVSLTNLKFSNAEVNKIVTAIREHMRLKQFGDKCPPKKSLRKLIASVTEDNLAITLDLMHADNLSHAKGYCLENQIPLVIEELKTLDTQEVAKVPLPIDGKDIMKEFGFKPSPIVGECLKWAEDLYFEKPEATKEEYIEYIKAKLTV